MQEESSSHLFQSTVSEGEPTEIISFRVPKSWNSQINSVIAASGKTRSQYFRDLIENAFFGTNPSSTHDLLSVEKRRPGSVSKLSKHSFAEKIIQTYPTPIALAYQKFYDSRFNTYEHMQRLIALYEQATFFVFNLVFADLLQRLNPAYIQDKKYRNAYKDYSVERRLGFIQGMLTIASSNHDVDLFTPELAISSFVDYAQKLRNVRNDFAHSGTASESKQRKLLEEYKPIIDELLHELEFLSNYRLVQIPSFHYEGGQFIYQMTIYQGTIPLREAKPLKSNSQTGQPCLAEHNHLVMLNDKGQVLDLHPLYQLVSDDKTQHEEHICFLKDCKEEKIHVESIHTSVVLTLEGLEDLKKLAETKLLSQASGL